MSYIISVTMVDAETNEKEVLYERNNKRCRFKKWFRYKNYAIQLRLDYNGKLNVPPVLDADIKDTTTDELIKKGPWHHTEKKHDPKLNMDIYDFKFESLILRLYTITTAATDQSISVTVGKP